MEAQCMETGLENPTKRKLDTRTSACSLDAGQLCFSHYLKMCRVYMCHSFHHPNLEDILPPNYSLLSVLRTRLREHRSWGDDSLSSQLLENPAEICACITLHLWN